jgi:hypothetical protein
MKPESAALCETCQYKPARLIYMRHMTIRATATLLTLRVLLPPISMMHPDAPMAPQIPQHPI